MKNRRNRNHHNNNNNNNNSNWKNQNNNQPENKPFAQKQKVFQFNKAQYEDNDAELKRQQSIIDLKARQTICPVCNQLISDVSSAITDKSSGKPAHFDCVLNNVSKDEKLGENEKIAYIGQGRFGVLFFENPRDPRKFTIKKIIEVEDRDAKPQWRDEISGLYSQVQ